MVSATSKVFMSVVLVLTMSCVILPINAVPIANYENIEIVSRDGKAFSLDDIRKALSIAAIEKNWRISDATLGKATATLVVRGMHTIVVDITYTEKAISIKYKDSTNMNYNPAHKDSNTELDSSAPEFASKKSEAVIHPKYNVWVSNLVKAIQVELLRMT